MCACLRVRPASGELGFTTLHTKTIQPLLPFPTKHYDHGHRPAEYVAPVTTTMTHHTPDVIVWVGNVRVKTGAVDWVGVVTLDGGRVGSAALRGAAEWGGQGRL